MITLYMKCKSNGLSDVGMWHTINPYTVPKDVYNLVDQLQKTGMNIGNLHFPIPNDYLVNYIYTQYRMRLFDSSNIVSVNPLQDLRNDIANSTGIPLAYLEAPPTTDILGMLLEETSRELDRITQAHAEEFANNFFVGNVSVNVPRPTPIIRTTPVG